MKCKAWWLTLLYYVSSWDCKNPSTDGNFSVPDLTNLSGDWPFVSGSTGMVKHIYMDKNIIRTK